jgi:hypothetical protein
LGSERTGERFVDCTKIYALEYLGHDAIKDIYLILFRLAPLVPNAIAPRLGEATPLFEATMKGPTIGIVRTQSSNTWSLERAAELQRSTPRAIATLSKIAGTGAALRFDALVDLLKNGGVMNYSRGTRRVVGV